MLRWLAGWLVGLAGRQGWQAGVGLCLPGRFQFVSCFSFLFVLQRIYFQVELLADWLAGWSVGRLNGWFVCLAGQPTPSS